MAASRGGLRRCLTYGYLTVAEALMHRLLRGRSGERDFRRVIIVAALGRNNGIASGARLQWNALRQLGVDTDLLDVTPALRNPLFRLPHRPGSAYVFHAGGPQTANLIGSVLPHAADALPHRLLGLGIAGSTGGLDGLRPQRRRNLDAERLFPIEPRPLVQAADPCRAALHPCPPGTPAAPRRAVHRPRHGRQPIEPVAQKSRRRIARFPCRVRFLAGRAPRTEALRPRRGTACARGLARRSAHRRKR